MTNDEYLELRAKRVALWMDEAHDIEELHNILSDYHKDTHGFRWRGGMLSRQEVAEQLAQLDMYHTVMRETFAGREELRANGWHVPETDPVQQVMADQLASMRDEGDADGLWRAEIVH